jgi:[lysine-biosynthesis-protein LysW]--L-2-aminoadipate ligase
VTAELAVLASRVRADERRILDALERRGVPHRHLDPRISWTGVPGAGALSGIVLNREISLTRAVYAAHTLEAQGATVVNSASATELCGDKWRTTLALVGVGLPIPYTALALTPESALEALEDIGYPAVLKPVVGSWGRMVAPLPDRSTAVAFLEYVEALPGPRSHVVYVQRMVLKAGRDIRVAVVGGEVVGASYRRAAEWRTNVHRGAQSQYCEATPEITRLAVAAAEAVRADICGVDLIQEEDGDLFVLEVNHGLEFSGLQHALGDRVDVADRIVDHLVERSAR